MLTPINIDYCEESDKCCGGGGGSGSDPTADEPYLEWKLQAQGVLAEEIDKFRLSVEMLKELCKSDGFRRDMRLAIISVIGSSK